jgi:hypothetical protein
MQRIPRPPMTVSTADIPVLLCAEVYTFTMSRAAHMPRVCNSLNTSKVNGQGALWSPPKVRLKSRGDYVVRYRDHPSYMAHYRSLYTCIKTGQGANYTQFSTSSHSLEKWSLEQLKSEPCNPHSCTVIPGYSSTDNSTCWLKVMFNVHCINIIQVIRSWLH